MQQVLACLILNIAAPAADAKVEAAEAKADAAKASSAADAASKKAEAAEDKAEDLEKQLGSLASGTIIEHGITGGFAVGIHVPVLRGKWQAQTAEIAALPYVLILPAYWWSSPEVRRYCGVSWTKGKEGADEAANVVARARAVKIREELLRHIRAGTVSSATDALEVLSTNIDNRAFRCAQEVASDVAGACSQDALDDMIAIQDVGWTYGLKPKGRCVAHKLLGFWVGFPVNVIKPRVSGNQFGTTLDGVTSEVRPRVSFGYGLTINAWFSLLLGTTYSTIDVSSTDADGVASIKRGNVWTVVVAPAFNIDIVNSIIKAVN